MKVRKILLFTLVCFAFVTLLAVFANLGDRGSAPAITTKRPGTSTSVTVSTTAPPITTAPPVTTPPSTPGQELVKKIEPYYVDSGSGYSYDGFYLARGDRARAFVPIEAPEKGIYRITLDVTEVTTVGYYSMYIRNGYGELGHRFVSESFDSFESSISMDLALDEGINQVTLWLVGQDLKITSVTYEKIGDYDILIDIFSADGVGASYEWSGNPRLYYEDGSNISTSVIRSKKITIAEDGTYDLSFIAGSKCLPVVRVCDSAGAVVKEFTYSCEWNGWGVDPIYSNISTVYLDPNSDIGKYEGAKTVELATGEYYIEVTFGWDYNHGDTILVHSAYLTKK